MDHCHGLADFRRASAGAHLVRAVGVTVTAAFLSACSTVPVYNEARDKQAQELAQSAAKIDLVALVDAVQARFAALSELDVQTRQAHADMRRNLEVAVVAGDTKPLRDAYAVRFLEKRMHKLAGATLSPEQWRKSNDAQVDAAVHAEDARKEVRRFGKRIQADVDSCDDLGAYGTGGRLNPGFVKMHGNAAALIYEKAAELCAKGALQPASAGPGSHIADLQQQLQKAQRAQAERALALTDMQQRLQQAKQAYDQEVKSLAPKPEDAGYRAQLAGAADKLGSALKAIEKAAGEEGKLQAFLQASTLENVQALEKVTDVVASGESDFSRLDPEQKRAVAILRLLPTMADESDRMLKEAQRPRVAPLMLSLDQQRLALESYQQEQKLQDRQVASYRKALDLAWQEYQSLGRARYLLESGDAAARVPLERSLSEVISARNPRQLYALYGSLAEYFDQSQLLRVQSEAAEVSGRSYLVDREMLRSKYAALQWQKLLNDMASVLADFHKSGVKPQDIAEFAKALGLIYIGSQTGN